MTILFLLLLLLTIKYTLAYCILQYCMLDIELKEIREELAWLDRLIIEYYYKNYTY
jgi:hypothetical protein